MARRRSARQARPLPGEQELRTTRLGWWLLGLLPGLLVAWLVHQFHVEQQEQLRARVEALRSAQAGEEAIVSATAGGEANQTDPARTDNRPRFEFYQLLTETGLSSTQPEDDRPTPERTEPAPPDQTAQAPTPDETAASRPAEPEQTPVGTDRDSMAATMPISESPTTAATSPAPVTAPANPVQRPTPEPATTGRDSDPPAASPASTPEPPAAGGDGRYLIQAGTFREAGHADALRARLALLGLNAQTEILAGDSNLARHRVRVGPIDGRQQANRLMARLRDNEINAILLRLEN